MIFRMKNDDSNGKDDAVDDYYGDDNDDDDYDEFIIFYSIESDYLLIYVHKSSLSVIRPISISIIIITIITIMNIVIMIMMKTACILHSSWIESNDDDYDFGAVDCICLINCDG